MRSSPSTNGAPAICSSSPPEAIQAFRNRGIVQDVRVDDDRIARLAAEYRRFSTEETRGRSALYTELTREVAEDRELLAIMCELEPAKRQPNLLLRAVRYLYGDFARDWPQFRLVRLRAAQPPRPAGGAALLLSLDGEPRGWADPHGAWLRWLA
jgi:Uncharacterized protein conserved in bacteria (DUF2332)